MRLAEIVVPRIGWVAGAVALTLCGSLALRSVPAEVPVVDVPEQNELAVHIRDTAGVSCASDVVTQGSRVFVHLREDAKTCAGVVRVYRVEGDHLVFEQELVDI